MSDAILSASLCPHPLDRRPFAGRDLQAGSEIGEPELVSEFVKRAISDKSRDANQEHLASSPEF